MQANALAESSPASLAPRLALYRSVLWIALAAYPWIIRLLAASVQWGAAAVFGALAIALIPPAAAWLALSEANRPGRNPRAWPGLAQEALLGAICAPLFVILSVLLRAALGGWRDAVWYAVLAAVAATRWLPAPSEEAGPAWRWRRVHYAAAAIVALFGLAHVANHVTAIYSLDGHVAVQNALRLVYRQPVVQTILLIAIALQMSTGVRLIWGARSYRFTALRNLQILSGANLVAFFVSHLSATLILGPRILKADTTFAWATGGAHGMLGSPASTQLLPYYFLGVASFFLHLGAAARWSLIPAFGPAGARRIAYALMIGGAIVALALVFPMLGTRLLS